MDGVGVDIEDRSTVPDHAERNTRLVTLSRELRELSLIHISEPTRLLSTSYAVFCLKKKNNIEPEDFT